MKLSIITINYNNAEGLRKTLASVAAQTYTNIEHIIVDGGSTDGSVEVIEAYASGVACTASGCGIKDAVSAADAAVNSQPAKGAQLREATQPANGTLPAHSAHHQILWVSEPDKGIYNAMNKGLEIALGKRIVNDDHTSSPLASRLSPDSLSEYIQILNSGDILAAPDVTERMMAALAQQGKESSKAETDASSPLASRLSPIQNRPAIFYGNMIKEYPDGRCVKDTCGSADYTPESFLYFYKGTLNHDCAYIRRDLFEKYGLYNEQMKICSDWEWYVRAIVLGGEKTVYTNIDVTIFDMTGISESGGKNKELILNERREYLESILPAAVLRDYDKYAFPISQYQRLKKYHLWGIVYFMERVLFKFEKWFNKG